MTTINGVTFNMVNLRPVVVHRNSMSEQPGSDTNFITDMGYDGLVLRLEGFEETLATYDSVISEFMKSGEQTLVYRTGWQFTVYSVQLTPELIEGIVDNFFPYDLILYTSTPYRESTTLSCRAKAITVNNQEWSVEDMPCNNLLDNWSMEDWSAGTTSAPDSWVQSSGTILKETSVVKVGSVSARITPAYANLYQEISFPTKYRGSVLTFGCWIYSSAGNNSYLRIQDSAGYSNSDFHDVPGGWAWKTVTRTIDSAATFIRVHCSMNSTNITAYYDGAVLIEGDSISDNTFVRDIDTDGSVDAVPDIQVTGDGIFEVDNSTDDSNYNFNNSLSGVTITQSVSNSAQVVDISYGVGQTFDCRKVGLAIIDSVQIDVVSVTTGATVYCTVYDKVGGTQLGSKSLSITTTGLKTFTFDTPIAVVQDDNTCTNGTDTSRIAIFISTFSGDITVGYQNTNVYSDGMLYINSAGGNQDYPTRDLKIVLTGHSCKEIQQTFEVPVAIRLISIILEMCKYQYTGTNVVTVVVKEGVTTLGTGTVVLSGSTFSETKFILSEETTDSLLLSASTTYTIIITPPSDTGNTTGILIKTNSTNVYSDGSVTLIEDGGTSRAQSQDLNFIAFLYPSNTGVQIYNISDTSIKCSVANEILNGAIHKINADGTGTIYYDDDFSTEKWGWNSTYSNITHDTGNDELDIADDGYIYWLMDTKGPVTGIPTLTSQINVTTGTPTIQISTDGSTWYDIPTVIVDDVNTVYELDSSSLHLKGQTAFYWRFDCVKAGAATCSIKSFELDINIVTIDFEHPLITTGGTASTVRCDQDSDSGMNCTVALYYRGRSWPA